MKKQMKLLAAEQDRKRLKPVLDALERKGLRVSDARDAGKNDLVLAALSESFYDDAEKTDALLGLIGAGAENVLPLQIDGARIPDELKNALYARNIIPAAERDAELIAERIVSALPQRKSRLPLALAGAGVLLLSIVGFLILRSVRNREDARSDENRNEIVLPASIGLTEEDLSSVRDAVIVGDRVAFFREEDYQELGYWPHADAFAYLDEMVTGGEKEHWYSKETGQEFGMTRYDDLRFLALMPNLRELTLVCVEADREALPDFRNSSSLREVQLLSCEIDGIDWLAGSSIETLTVRFCPVRDFNVLTDCGMLDSLQVDMYRNPVQTDFSSFAPPALTWLWLWHLNPDGELDLSALSGCAKLRDVTFGNLPLSGLSCLAGLNALKSVRLSEMQSLKNLSGMGGLPIEDLWIENSNTLRDISAVGDLKKLRYLYIGYCPRITDYSPISGCTALEAIHFQCDYNPDALRDASFLAGLPKLNDIGLYACNLRNMDFLEGIASNQDSIRLGFAGDILDYSGLAAVRKFDYLHVNPRYFHTGRGGDFSAVLPYIRDAEIDSLMLYTCAGVDLSQLPDEVHELSIRYGDLTDLSGLKPYYLRRLELWDCQYLRSLDGLENLPTLSLFGSRGQMELSIVGCPHLTDYSAMNGAYLETLKLTGVCTMPELEQPIKVNNLFLESIDEFSDLSYLRSSLMEGDGCNLYLVGLDSLYDLTPLNSFRGKELTVPPQVADQAEELVKNGNYQVYDVAYPDGSWQPFDGTVTLLTLDELDTLPKSVLQRVDRLYIVGDVLIDPEAGEIREERNGAGIPGLVISDRATGEQIPIEYGEGTVRDMGIFSELTGLKELRLYAQPLENLDGIQALPELESLTVAWCPALEDTSAAFACPQLRHLDLHGCPVESIQGVQNLRNLAEMNLNDTKVADLSPLTQLDYSAASSEYGGFRLQICSIPAEDYSPLASIPVLDSLNLNADARLVLPHLVNTEVHRFSANNVLTDGKDAVANGLFADFIRSHPRLTELRIPWNPGITDLKPVLELQNLEYLRVSFNMKEAIATLDGQEYRFTFEIEGK